MEKEKQVKQKKGKNADKSKIQQYRYWEIAGYNY